jgi:uncharacterized membrane protein
MSEQPEMGGMGGMGEVTSDDKLWVLLAYVFTPLIPIVILLMEDRKVRPFIRAHNAQALVVGVINFVIAIAIGWTLIFACVPLLIWLVCIYWGFQGYSGKYVQIPVITSFVRNQGWA